ncbi:MAG: hypothetical protein HY321_18960 [Armatimonadetes bacterium]|nr:hypothetical protein [Armatimonadota bacterium]
MRELIDEATANLVVNVLALALPAAGAIVGAVVGRVRGRPRAGTVGGLAVGCLGIANWLLWRLYNAVTGRLGLDTVANLIVNLALFVVLGAAAGVAAGVWVARRRDP